MCTGLRDGLTENHEQLLGAADYGLTAAGAGRGRAREGSQGVSKCKWLVYDSTVGDQLHLAVQC
jgi:hypothetical protein